MLPYFTFNHICILVDNNSPIWIWLDMEHYMGTGIHYVIKFELLN